MNGDGNYFPEHVTGPVTMTYWCAVCSAEPGKLEMDVDIFNNGNFVPLWVGERCLTSAEEEDKIEK